LGEGYVNDVFLVSSNGKGEDVGKKCM